MPMPTDALYIRPALNPTPFAHTRFVSSAPPTSTISLLPDPYPPPRMCVRVYVLFSLVDKEVSFFGKC